MRFREQTVAVNKKNIVPCKHCGQPITFLKYSSGAVYPADVSNGFVITGAGNHFNLKPRHHCVKMDRVKVLSEVTGKYIDDYRNANLLLDELDKYPNIPNKELFRKNAEERIEMYNKNYHLLFSEYKRLIGIILSGGSYC